jgi:hypothetical protein
MIAGAMATSICDGFLKIEPLTVTTIESGKDVFTITETESGTCK